MAYLIVYCISWVITFIVSRFSTNTFLYDACLVQLVFSIGFFGLYNFTGHVLLKEKVAKSIGWASNGFQIELGAVSLGIGICGVLCYWFRDGFWVATAIPFSVFLLSAAALHIKEIAVNKNYNPGNVFIIVPDIVMPLTLIFLLWRNVVV